MDKNTIIGLILIALVLFGFSYWNTQSVQQNETATTEASATQPQEDNAKKANATTKAPAIQAAEADTTSLFHQARTGTSRQVVLQNGKVRVAIDTKGGVIRNVQLKEYKSYADFKAGKEQPLTLINEQDADMSLTFETKEENICTTDYFFEPVAQTDSTVTMRLAANDGSAIELCYKLLPDNYMVNFSVKATGMAGKFSSKTKTFAISWQDRVRQQEKGFYFESLYSALTYKLDGDDTEKIGEQSTEEKAPEGRIDWFAFKNQYFSSILIADQSLRNAEFKSVQEEEGSGYLKNYTAGANAFFDPTGKQSTDFQFYFGPNRYRLLQSMQQYATGDKELELQELVYLGWPLFRWINRYFTLYVFDWLTQLGLPMGIVLLLITLLLRVIVYVPTRKSYMSSAKMRVLKPKIDELAKKYPNKEDAMKRQQETMTLYSQYGVSPMGGCLPMILQMPIWIAMFNFVPNAIELRQQSFLWADDLSTYDDVINWGVHIWGLGDHLSLFCILFCATNLLYSYLSMRQQRESMSGEQAEQMKMMQWMMYLMPLFFFFMFNKYSAGLNYYYFISLLFSALTMWYLRYTTDDAKLLAKLEANYQANKNNPNKKPSGLAARLEALQKQQEELRRRQEQAGRHSK